MIYSQSCGAASAQGWLSGILIDEMEDMPSSSSRTPLWQLNPPDGRLCTRPRLPLYPGNRHLRKIYPGIIEDAIRRIEGLGGYVHREVTSDLIYVNEEISVSLIICRCFQRLPNPETPSWYGRPDHHCIHGWRTNSSDLKQSILNIPSCADSNGVRLTYRRWRKIFSFNPEQKYRRPHEQRHRDVLSRCSLLILPSIFCSRVLCSTSGHHRKHCLRRPEAPDYCYKIPKR